MMDIKEAQQIAIQSGKGARRIQKAIRYIEKKILKMCQLGEFNTRFNKHNLFTAFGRLRGEEHEVVIKYLRDLRFELENYTDFITVCWLPENYSEIFEPCTEQSRLKHLVTTGQSPQVMMEKKE